MARFRLTAARGTAPLGQPPIASARDIQIPRPLYLPYPTLIHIPIQPEEPGGFARAKIPVPSLSDGGFAPIPLPQLLRTRPLLAPSSDGHGLAARLSEIDFWGGRFDPLPMLPRTGPLSAPRGASRLRDGGAFPGTELLALIRPRLEPPRGAIAGGTQPSGLQLRGYQEEAVRQLLAHEGFLLADDLGMGKTASACAALHRLVFQGEVKRALIVCLEAARPHWMRSLSDWAPGIVGIQVDGDPAARSQAWSAPAHVTVVDYPTLSDDIRSGRLAGVGLEWDLVVLDDALAARQHATQPIPEYERLQADRRWALSSVVPRRAEEWLSIFLFLTPGTARGGAAVTLPDLEKRFLPETLHRSKHESAGELPPITRDRIWVSLDRRQRVAYWEILEEERRRLAELGRAVTRAHIERAVGRLKQACNFAPGSLDGAKVRPLVDLVEDVAASGGRVAVLSQFRPDSLDRLHRVLEAFGTLRLDSTASPAEQGRTLKRLHEDERWHVLLADFDLRPEGAGLPGVGWIVHFDHRWNPADRRRAEQRLIHPGPSQLPVNVYEFWVAGTVDEKLDAILAERGLLPEDLPAEIRPAQLDDRMTTSDWLGRILEVPGWEQAP
jgi:hypothetical protein